MAGEDAGAEAGSLSPPGPEEDHRERRVWWTLVAVGFVVFIAVVLLGRPLVQARLNAARNVDRATAMITATNADLIKIDSAVRASDSTMTPEAIAKALATVGATRKTLQEASGLLQQGYDRLTEDEQRRAVIVKSMATARLELLVSAETALSTSGTVNGRAIGEYKRAVEKVRQADAALAGL